MRKWNYIISNITSILLAAVLLLGVSTTASASNGAGMGKRDSGYYTIMGESSVTIGQMVNYYQASARYPSFYANTEAPTIYAFVQIYMEECRAEGVKAEVAFAQCMHETAYLQYTNCDVYPTQYNFAGLDTWGKQADGTVVRGRSYSSVRQGIRAHVQRLKAWAVKGTTASSFKNPCIDRDKFTNWWMSTCVGSAPYVQYLEKDNNPSGYGWATDPQYTEKMMRHLNLCLSASRYTTWYQGVDYSAIYNPDYYLGTYGDIARAYAGREEDAIGHFVSYGMNEGRQGTTSFNVYSYKRQYADLRMAYGNNLYSYYQHYVQYGVNERRIGTGCSAIQGAITNSNGVDYSAVYDFDYYCSANSDIKRIYGDDDLGALRHFVTYGMREGRRASAQFDVRSYYNRYADLRRAYGTDWKQYYLHYIRYGKREGRSAVNCGTLQNPTTTYNGVNYASIYDYNYYISKYPDIARAFGGDENKTLQHFITYGMREGRQGSANFNVQIYANRYGDLREAYGNNLPSYYMHYIYYGIREGRSGK